MIDSSSCVIIDDNKTTSLWCYEHHGVFIKKWNASIFILTINIYVRILSF